MIVKAEKLDIKQNTKEWEQIRYKYVGSSELATLLNISSYHSKKELLLKKLGYLKQEMIPVMAAGHVLEPLLGDNILPYFEEDILKTYQNIKDNKKVRDVKKDNNVYLLTFSSIDYGDVSIIVSPDYVDNDNYPYDIKTMNPYSFNAYRNKPMAGDYIVQSLCQQLLFQKDYGYLFIFVSPSEIYLDKIRYEDYEVMIVNNLIPNLKEFYENLEKARNMELKDIINNFYIDADFIFKQINPYLEEPIIPSNDKLVISLDNIPDNVTNISDEVVNTFSHNVIDSNDKKSIIIDVLTNMSREYIQNNEIAKDANKKCDVIKSIFQQIGVDYKELEIISPDGYKIIVNLKPFKIKIL